MNVRTAQACAALVLLLGGLVSQPAAASQDYKSVSPMECLPRGPGTTFAELTYGPYGITNPGTSSESVICPIPGDSESGWTTTPGESASLVVYYRIGSVSGNISCTAFTGTTAVTSASGYSVSHASPTQAAGTRGFFLLSLADSSGILGGAPPASLVCTLSPKAALGWISFLETQETNVP